MMNVTLKKIGEDYFCDQAREDEVYDYHAFEIYANNIKVGTISIIDRFNDSNDICYVERIDIDEEYRGQGIGTEVLKNVLYADLRYYSTVVAPDNEDAKRLYERIGEEYEYLNCECDFRYNNQGYGVYVI